MTDMLIKLYDLPSVQPFRDSLSTEGIFVRRAMSYERTAVTQWVGRTFSSQWADECQAAFGRHPVGCHIALTSSQICGFCCTDCTFLGFLGPIGTASGFQGKGIGKVLLLAALEAMWGKGYAYAIVGDAGHPGFFETCAGAVGIEDSTPGPYPKSAS